MAAPIAGASEPHHLREAVAAVGIKTNFGKDLTDTAAVAAAVTPILDSLIERIERTGAKSRTVMLKRRYAISG